MFEPLNADGFEYQEQTREEAFQLILIGIVECYKMMLRDKALMKNDENKIRDKILEDYLNKNKNQLGLNLFLFEKEIREANYAGRVDIRITSYNLLKPKEDYYIIECKRLNNQNLKGTTGLNAEYIKKGLHRFTTKYYTAFEGFNAMIGFVVESMDIHENIENLNCILLDYHLYIDTINEITKADFINNFEFHYTSTHLDDNVEGLKIYHLMLDVSNNIER